MITFAGHFSPAFTPGFHLRALDVDGVFPLSPSEKAL